MSVSRPILTDLAATIAERRAAAADTSYTKSLLDAGIAKCARKLGEEATEAIIAALERDREGLRAEAADLLYHLLVLLEAGDVPFAEVEAELARRTGRSGLDEKASREKG